MTIQIFLVKSELIHDVLHHESKENPKIMKNKLYEDDNNHLVEKIELSWSEKFGLLILYKNIKYYQMC